MTLQILLVVGDKLGIPTMILDGNGNALLDDNGHAIVIYI